VFHACPAARWLVCARPRSASGSLILLAVGCAALLAAAWPRPAAGEERPLREIIDAEIEAAWKKRGITPAPPADDAVFLRRVHLDLVGTIPTYDETKVFLDDRSPDKRARLVDRLLEDPRYAQHQADVWDMVLFGRNPPGYETNKRPGFQKWLREQFARNVPYDEWVGQILKAEGNSVDDGPPMYFVQYKRAPEDATQAITQQFLGVQLQCARCHDHPFEDWSQRDFYGMASFLARLEVVSVGKKDSLTMYAIGEANTGDVLFSGPAIDQVPGTKGEPIKPKFLHGDMLEEPPLPADYKEAKSSGGAKFEEGKIPPPPYFSRKNQLAEWITAVDNPYFARAVANRVWGQYLGRGLVHPVDNMSEANEPSHPELLRALARAMVERKFDLKAYIRELVNSRAYQLGPGGATSEALPQWFERARVRPLSAEELLESWRVATGYDAAGRGTQSGGKERFHGVTWDYMVRYFGTPSNGAGDFQGGLHEHLYLNNGELPRLIVSDKGSLVDAMMNSAEGWPERVDRLYLSILNRPPREEEREKFVAYLTADKDPAERVKEAIWTLLTCSEYRFNH
jgi:hypothetical protein